MLSSIKHPLSSYVSKVSKAKGQFLAFPSQSVVITIPTPIQDINSIRKSTVFELEEITIIWGV